MKIKFLYSKLEFELKKKFPEIPLEEIYYSRRRNIFISLLQKLYMNLKEKMNFLKKLKNFMKIT